MKVNALAIALLATLPGTALSADHLEISNGWMSKPVSEAVIPISGCSRLKAARGTTCWMNRG